MQICWKRLTKVVVTPDLFARTKQSLNSVKKSYGTTGDHYEVALVFFEQNNTQICT